MPDLSAAFEGGSVEDIVLLLRLVYCPEEACGSSFSGERPALAAVAFNRWRGGKVEKVESQFRQIKREGSD